MKTILSAILLVFSLMGFSQIKFEKGYFITNDGEKHEVLIKNIDWLNNPTEFIYKISESAAEQMGTLKEVKEFDVYGFPKLVRYKGNIDYSSTDLNKISDSENPEYVEKEVFLYQIVEGKKSLYSYNDDAVLQYFYSDENKEIKPLVHKLYHYTDEKKELHTDQFVHNNKYKEQLKKLFSDNTKTLSKIDFLNYEAGDLKKIFYQYNGIENHKKNDKSQRITFNLSLRPGINFTSLSVFNPYFNNNEEDKFPNKQIFRIGAEAEIVMPFNKNKWSFVIEPSYFSYKNSTVPRYYYQDLSAKFSFLDLFVGVRHYMFLNDHSKIFINAGASKLFKLSNENYVQYSSSYSENKIEVNAGKINFAIGAGFNYRNKYSLEARYVNPKNILDTYLYWNSKFPYFSLIFGYNIF